MIDIPIWLVIFLGVLTGSICAFTAMVGTALMTIASAYKEWVQKQ